MDRLSMPNARLFSVHRGGFTPCGMGAVSDGSAIPSDKLALWPARGGFRHDVTPAQQRMDGAFGPEQLPKIWTASEPVLAHGWLSNLLVGQRARRHDMGAFASDADQ